MGLLMALAPLEGGTSSVRSAAAHASASVVVAKGRFETIITERDGLPMDDIGSRLRRLEGLRREGLIAEQECQERRRALLDLL